MRFRALLLAIIAPLLVAPVAAFAQYTTVTANHIQDDGGNPLASGTLCFTPINSSTNRPSGFALGSGGGQVHARAYCVPITAGSIGGSAHVADLSQSSPAAPTIGYQIVVTDQSNFPIETFSGLAYPSGATWSFDSWVPTTTAVAIPAGTISYASSNPTGSCASPSFVDTDTQLYHCVSGAYVPIAASGVSFSSDLSGNASAQTVTGIQGHSVPATLPIGTSLQSNGSAMQPSYGAFYANGVQEFGDSLCGGAGATQYSKQFCNRVGLAFGYGVNYAFGGDQAADTAFKYVFKDINTHVSQQLATLIEDGTNDVHVCASGVATAGCLANFSHALTSSIVWTTLPEDYAVVFGNCPAVTGCSTTGTWTQDSTYQANLALSTVVNGTVTFTTVLPSKYMTLTWDAKDGDTATATLSCDSGAITDTLNAFGFNSTVIATQNGTTETPFTNVYTFPTAGTHTCTVTATASTGNKFMLIEAGSPQTTTNYAGAVTQNNPRAFVMGVVQQGSGNQDSVTAAYDAQVQATVTAAAATGLQAVFVPTRNFVNDYTTPTTVGGITYPALNNLQYGWGGANCTTGGVMPNGRTFPADNPTSACGYHPNDVGHDYLYQAVVATAQPIPSPGISGTFNVPLKVNAGPQTPYAGTEPNVALDMSSYWQLNNTNPVAGVGMGPGYIFSSADLGVGFFVGADFAQTAAGTYQNRRFAVNGYQIADCFFAPVASTYPGASTTFSCPWYITDAGEFASQNLAMDPGVAATSTSGNIAAPRILFNNYYWNGTASANAQVQQHTLIGAGTTPQLTVDLADCSNYAGLCIVTINLTGNTSNAFVIPTRTTTPSSQNLPTTYEVNGAAWNPATNTTNILNIICPLNCSDATGTLTLQVEANTTSIGGSALAAGACASGTATLTGVATGTPLRTPAPATYPGDGFYFLAYMSAANTATVKVCATVAGTPTASIYTVSN